jgi:tetratricopeptide (TPR) repeat protein
MPLDWFNVREAAAVGVALADQLAPQTPAGGTARAKQPAQSQRAMQDLLRSVDRQVGALRLNFYKRAKLANSFKWRLLERGVEQQVADDATQALVMHLLTNSGKSPEVRPVTDSAEKTHANAANPEETRTGNFKQLLAQGNDSFARGDYQQALVFYEQLVELKPRSAEAHNNLGAALYKLDRYGEAEEHLRRAVKLKFDYPEALSNLGAVLQWQGCYTEAEALLRRALKLRPDYADARSLLGKSLALRGRPGQARAQFEKTLKIVPRHIEALIGMGQLAGMEGRFDEAEEWFNRALRIEGQPRTCSALASLVGLRRMTKSDVSWLERARGAIKDGAPPTEEIALYFAIGKYHDDLGNFAEAFQNYKQGNDRARRLSPAYAREARTRYVDDVIRAYSRETVVAAGASQSERPIFVVGMPRSGTTLMEQIIASHPQASGAGELEFWNVVARKHEAQIRRGPLDETTRKTLAEQYLDILSDQSKDALRVVDKAPVNAEYLGVIHSVFPRARIIYMLRNPIDTCLSCYFQNFSQALSFTSDLSDLEHYYRQHHRLMQHWRRVLLPGTLLDVKYEDLVANSPVWSRRVLEFIGLPWDERCLDFHQTERGIATASAWQVRQRIYKSSVERWRKYEKFIGPLMSLKELQA